MQKNSFFSLTLIAVAVLAGCGTTAVKPNATLAAAHSSYDSAQSDPQVTQLAALELKDAGDTLARADNAVTNHQGANTVEHLAYIASQQVGIAQATAKRKTAELEVSNAGARRNEVRLEARTAEADAAKLQAARAQEMANSTAAELAAANVNAQRDQADLAAANANAQRDQELIAQQQAQLQALNAKKTDRGMVITLGDVLFSTDKAQLSSGGVHNVQKLADFLKQYPKQKVLIEGHTDSTGSDEHNQALSERRASSVQMALTGMGISGDRVSMRGYGEGFPVASNDNAASRQLNRRVEIILSDANGNIIQR
ncbi:MAG: OmpA family protein [Gallionella sp.]|nr:OmpA family protein [Gallionella sp.]